MRLASRTTSAGARAPSEAVEWVCRSTNGPAVLLIVTASPSVVRLRRREARLRLTEESEQVGVAHLGQRLFARARALRGVSCDTHGSIFAAARNEDESELIAVVLRDSTGGEHAPGSTLGADGSCRHLGELYLGIDSGRIEGRLRRGGVSAGERVRVRSLGEFQKRTRKLVLL